MFKLLFFALSLFSFTFNDNYQIVTEETDNLSNVVFYEKDVLLKNITNNSEEDNEYLLSIGGKKYNVVAKIASGIMCDNYFILIYYQDNYMYSQRYFFDGKVEQSDMIYYGEMIGDLFIRKDGGAVYCGFTEYYQENYNPHLVLIFYYENNVYIEEFNYGKDKNEKLVGYDVFDEKNYFIVQKDQITESEFGNGGCDDCYVIAILKNMKVENIVTINCNDQLKYFCVRNNYIYCVLKNKLYLFDLDLNLLNTLTLEDFNNIFIGYNKVILVIKKNSFELYDGASLVLINSFDNLGIRNYREFSNVLYQEVDHKYYLFDIVDFSKTLMIGKYLYEYEDILNVKLKEVSSLFGDCLFIGKDYLEYYKRNAYGNYHLNIKYQTEGLIKFDKEVIEKVPLQVNINNNNIYPNGYRLVFNGEGYLDGNLIISNHSVLNDGKHQLVIKGTNTEEVIDFYVSSDQYQFDDKYFDDEIINLKASKEFSIFYELSEDVKIKEVVVLGAEVEEFKVENQKLEIIFKGISNLGITNVIIEKIVCIKDYYLEEVYLNKLITINVYQDGISFNDVVIDEDCGCTLEYYDSFKQGRYLEIRVINNQYDYLFNFPIGNSSVNISGINSGNYIMIVSIWYDNLCYQLESKELYRMTVNITNDCYIGDFKLLGESNGYYKIGLELNKRFMKNNILELKDNNKVIYNYLDEKKESNIMYSIIGFSSCFLIGWGIRYLLRKRKYKIIKKA